MSARHQRVSGPASHAALGRRPAAIIGGFLALFGTSACEEDVSPEHDFKAAWTEAGASVSTFTKVEDSPIGGEVCWSGTVDDIETLFCRYKDAESATEAHSSGLRHVGAHTGIAINQGSWMIVAIDRDNHDPSGKSINRIAKTFLSHKRVQKKPEQKKPPADGDKSGK